MGASRSIGRHYDQSDGSSKYRRFRADGELKFNYQGDMLLVGAGIAQLVEQLICNQ